VLFLFQNNLADDFFRVKDRIIRESLFRFGFFYVTPQLTLEKLGYSSNIFQYNSDPEPDWTADIGVDLRLATLLGKRFIFVVTDHPYFTFYAKNKQEQAWSNEFRFSAYSYVGPFNLKFTLDRDNLRRRPSAEFGARVRYLMDNERISIDFGNHSRFYINVYAEQNRMKYEDDSYLGDYDLPQFMDRNQYKLGINLNKIIFSRTVLFLNMEYFTYRFQNYSDRDGDGESFTVGLRFPTIGNITGSFKLGYQWSHPENPLYGDHSSSYGSGGVKMVVFKRFRVSVEYILDYHFSFYQPDSYYNQQSVIGGIEFYLSRQLKLGYKFQSGLLTYKNLEDSTIMRKDRIQLSRFFVGIKIFKKMGIGLEYSTYWVESEVQDYSRSYDFFGGYINYDF
jgi:hypothetical protein